MFPCLYSCSGLEVIQAGITVMQISADKQGKNDFSKRMWDPGKKKYYRYDTNNYKVYE